jgi:DNA-binding Xre family transcriptional regulator
MTMSDSKTWAPLAVRTSKVKKFTSSNALAARRTPPPPGMGAVRFRLHEYAAEHGLVLTKKGPHTGKVNRALIRRLTGVSDDALFYMLRYPQTIKFIHFRTLARLCHGLNCQPGDIMVYDRTEDSDAPLSETYKQDDEAGLGS